ncbi:MAG: Rpn family recombination-promoting nuclease/putative transposase [Treponema sp.]|jgi:predicted transposase/invertase (TIGR01784 family)|nr:Rpn family recombination-promoting nuclease/putative transposase [Treponema sp.]
MAVTYLPRADPFIDPCWDPVFKCIFAKDTPQSKKILSSLLSAILGREVEILDIAVNEAPLSRLTDRQIRYDVNCVLDKREKLNVEITLYPTASEVYKMEYYLGRLYTSQELRGAEYSYNSLRQCYQVSILAKRNLFKDRHYYHRFIYYDPERGLSFGGRTAIHTLELKKLSRAAEKPVSEMNAREKWGVYLACCTDPGKQELLRELIETEEGIGMAEAAIRGFTAEEVAYFHQISKEKYELDMRAHQHEAWKKGEAAGRAKGRAAGLVRGAAKGGMSARLEIARKLKARGWSVTEIAEDTGLPPDTIEKL